MKTALTEFLSAGFLVTRAMDRPAHLSANLLPDRIVSASGCIAPFVPDTWCLQWTQDTDGYRVEMAKAFALTQTALKEITVWATQRFDKVIKWPNVIVNLSTAQALVDLFLGPLPDIKVIELALHRSLTGVFRREAVPAPQMPGHAPNGRQGVYEIILQGKPPTHGGRVRGFEPLVFNSALSCSWLCNGLDTVIEQALGIKPNSYGLIETFAQAHSCTTYISLEDVGAEPGLWLPWLIIDHTRSVRHTGPTVSKQEDGGAKTL